MRTMRTEYAGGYYSKANVQYSIAYGISTRTENDVLAAFGEYNNPTTGDVFEIGNGNSNSRSNAFAVRKDGRAKVKTAPIEADDVVRKQELDKKVNSISLANSVYATDSSSHSTSILYSKDALVNSIAQRTANGRLKAADGVADDDLATVKQLNAVNGGEAVTPSTATPTATSGTFTSAEWAKLQANNNNYILFNNEIYRLADKAHSGTTGIWSYTHTGWDGTAIMDKSINVTVSTGAWTLVVGQESGGKLYLHNIKLNIPGLSTDATVSVFVNFVTNYGTSYTTATFQSEVIKESDITMTAAVEVIGGAHFADGAGYSSIFISFFWAGAYKCYTEGQVPYTEENVIKLYSLHTEYQDYIVEADNVDEL